MVASPSFFRWKGGTWRRCGGDETARAITTEYGYDVHDHLTSVTDPNGNVTSYTYDDFGRMRSQSSPVTGTTTYTYDAAGNLLTTVDALGTTTSRTYDLLNRPLDSTATSAATSETVQWTYDVGAYGKGGSRR